ATFAKGRPVFEHDIDCVAIFDVFKDYEVVFELSTKVSSETAGPDYPVHGTEFLQQRLAGQYSFFELDGVGTGCCQKAAHHNVSSANRKYFPINMNGFEELRSSGIAWINAYMADVFLQEIYVGKESW